MSCTKYACKAHCEETLGVHDSYRMKSFMTTLRATSMRISGAPCWSYTWLQGYGEGTYDAAISQSKANPVCMACVDTTMIAMPSKKTTACRHA